MKLYVRSVNGAKIYLREIAPNRKMLAKRIGGKRFVVNGKSYTVEEVLAEPDNSGTGTGMVVGGLIGLLGGPLTAIAGGTIGGLIGNTNDGKEKEIVNRFNTSRVEYDESY